MKTTVSLFTMMFFAVMIGFAAFVMGLTTGLAIQYFLRLLWGAA
jgi:hypothetical protein